MRDPTPTPIPSPSSQAGDSHCTCRHAVCQCESTYLQPPFHTIGTDGQFDSPITSFSSHGYLQLPTDSFESFADGLGHQIANIEYPDELERLAHILGFLHHLLLHDRTTHPEVQHGDVPVEPDALSLNDDSQIPTPVGTDIASVIVNRAISLLNIPVPGDVRSRVISALSMATELDIEDLLQSEIISWPIELLDFDSTSSLPQVESPASPPQPVDEAFRSFSDPSDVVASGISIISIPKPVFCGPLPNCNTLPACSSGPVVGACFILEHDVWHPPVDLPGLRLPPAREKILFGCRCLQLIPGTPEVDWKLVRRMFPRVRFHAPGEWPRPWRPRRLPWWARSPHEVIPEWLEHLSEEQRRRLLLAALALLVAAGAIVAGGVALGGLAGGGLGAGAGAGGGATVIRWVLGAG